MKSILENYLKQLTNQNNISLSVPPKPEMGDFAFGVFPLAKVYRKNPNEIAQELLEKINSNKPDFIEKVEQAWPYLNFFLSKDAYSDLFKKLLEEEILNPENKKRTIFVDYIWANVWKPLHIWHMCTPNLWQAIINVYRKLGYNVISDSHIWDWWIIFWKLIVAYKNWWDEEKLKENAVEHLFQLYVKATKMEEEDSSWKERYQEAFKKLSSWEQEYVDLWALFTKESILSANKQLSKLNVKPDYNIGESFYEWLNLPKLEDYPDLIRAMKDIVKELLEKQIATKNEDNSVGVVFPDELKIPSTILQKKNWTHGYLASDLAAVKYRIYNWAPEKIIYFVDVRQSLHFKQVFAISKLAWWTRWVDKKLDKEVELIHAPNGFVKLKDGAMSTRKGKIIKLEELLNESILRAKKIILEKRPDLSDQELEDLAEIIWIWAIKYEYLRKNRELDIVFDWDQFMTFEWNSAPYIMYSYVRWLSILDKNNIDNTLKLDKYIFETKQEQELVKKLSEYKNTLEETANKYYPHILANYIYELTKLFNNFYNNVPVLAEKDENKKLSRLALIKKTTDTIKDSFDLLGIKLPKKM
jgi:arginyl-tRNA synthetase